MTAASQSATAGAKLPIRYSTTQRENSATDGLYVDGSQAPTSLSVEVAGRDVRGVTLDSLRDTVGVVTQDAHLFHDTVRANLLYARPEATEDELAGGIAATVSTGDWFDDIHGLPEWRRHMTFRFAEEIRRELGGGR